MGGVRMNGTSIIPYKRHELVPLPVTAKDSNGVFFGQNVGGLLIGSDLKQEVVVISAHYDHLGRLGKQVFHGADDNASGTAAVLSIAAVFDSLAQQGIRSRRSILFVLFSGEEEGLLGSDHFVYNSPIPVGQFVGNLNTDMVGRVDQPHRKNPDYCYLISNVRGRELVQIAYDVNAQTVKLVLNQGGYDTQNDPHQLFYRSDHYNFDKRGVPALFFTNGEHIDYHKSSDTADKINLTILQKRATLVFQTAWLLANRSELK